VNRSRIITIGFLVMIVAFVAWVMYDFSLSTDL
jgi:hypothetical protein